MARPVPEGATGSGPASAGRSARAARRSSNPSAQGYVSYVINKSHLSGVHLEDGARHPPLRHRKRRDHLHLLDTVRVLLDVLEETTITVSPINACARSRQEHVILDPGNVPPDADGVYRMILAGASPPSQAPGQFITPATARTFFSAARSP